MPLSEIDEDKILFYDIETNHQFASYAVLKSIAVQYGLLGKPEMVVGAKAIREFKQKISSPEIFKVDFNGVNFDRIVLERSGYIFHPQNAHDLFLAFKTIAPGLPAFSLKFISFYYLADPHFPQMELEQWCAENERPMHEAPWPILSKYNKHDVTQTKDLFRLAWDIVTREAYWQPYLQDLMMGEPLFEMETEGGIYLDRQGCMDRLHRLQKVVQQQTNFALAMTHGEVANANSSKQLGRYFHDFDKLELELSDNGQFKVDKSVLVSLRDTNPLADCAYKIREANGEIKYFENCLEALGDETYGRTEKDDWIPIQVSVSSARTRRFTSQSLHRLNFQNFSEVAEEIIKVPSGQLGWWIDATQIENVVHIYESEDHQRRYAYEKDLNWNEYVWLCNMMYGDEKSKAEWDDREANPHPIISHWSKYKGAKTAKLAANFGMGIKKYAKMNGVSQDVATQLMQDLHAACPAMRELQRKVAFNIKKDGYVQDVFGYRYTGPVEKAYKIVAYLIQGCGTGSLPKAQIRANWESLRRYDHYMSGGVKCGVMCTTTHDENSGRIDLQLGDERILQLLQKLMYNMTEKFSPLFDNIPLRAKLYLSRTTASKAEECGINDHKKILSIINQ